mgnify:CR=1 FL=1
MRTITSVTLSLVLGTAALTGCGSGAPSASSWGAKVIAACKSLEADRQAAAAKLPADRPPTVEELMAFDAAFAPRFESFGKEIEAMKRPAGMDAKIDEMIAAIDGYSRALAKGGTDRSAAQAELDADGQTKEAARLEAAGTAAGLSECNG